MRNLKVFMAYNGSKYHGYQKQENAITVQEVVEKAMSTLLNQPVSINGCSRTDTGVHAKQYCFNVLVEHSIPCDGFVRGMNTLLPFDIAILSCEEVDESFHARFDSKGKQYLYRICNSSQRDVFTENLAFFYPYKLDVEYLNKVAQIMVGTHDFGAFCKAEAKEHLTTTIRTVTSISVVRNGEYVECYVEGTGFLHNMVRIIIGTLIFLSEGKRTEEDIIKALETGDRAKTGKTLSPAGLYLNKVFY